VLLTAPGAIFVTAAAFGVQRIPSTLPEIVFALFTGLNAATVGLVALAAYQLSHKVVTDQATRILLLLSGSIASCYDSQWLYPVLMVVGGLTTLLVDRYTLYRARQVLKRSTRTTPAQEPLPSVAQTEEIEMQLPRPAAPVARKSSFSGSNSIQPIELSTTTLRRSFRDRAESIERYPTPPLEAPERDSIPEVVEPEIYFRLTVKQGLLMCVFSLRASELPT
jgi:hypothetical protein